MHGSSSWQLIELWCCKQVQAQAGELNLQHASIAVWAYATLGLLEQVPMPQVVQSACAGVQGATSAQQLCNLAWALGIAGVRLLLKQACKHEHALLLGSSLRQPARDSLPMHASLDEHTMVRA